MDQDIELFAHAIAMSRKLQARALPGAPILHAIPATAPAEQYRTMIDKLNDLDPEGGWGRMKLGDVEFIASKGEWQIPGGSWV